MFHLDDVQNAGRISEIEKNLRQIQTLRSIALDLIGFLSQLENFQKRLWLKKKFVVATDYCITLDRIPLSLYPEIASNSRQWDQWEKLNFLVEREDDLFKPNQKRSIEYMKASPFLMVDTSLFQPAFKQSLLACLDNLDESIDGSLIHSDNFQALNLLEDRYREQVKCIYIDPPYNTTENAFAYKNQYKHSSWLSLINDRLQKSYGFLKRDGVCAVAIDDTESSVLRMLLAEVFGSENYVSTILYKFKYFHINSV